MTIAMRSNGTTQLRAAAARRGTDTTQLIAPESTVDGRVWTQQPCVVVRLAWLALPAALLVLAAPFLAATFASTRRARLGRWDASPLALFFHVRVVDSCWPLKLQDGDSHLQMAGAMTVVAAGMDTRISPRR
jgi:hypothetical protein